MKKCSISVCMESICFTCGNREEMAFIKKIIVEKRWEDDIELKGELCHGDCVQGQIVTIGGKIYSALATLSLKEIPMEKIALRKVK